MRWAFIVLAALPVAIWVAAQFGAFSGSVPPDLGVTDGRLKPPSMTRNSVSSQADLYPDHPQRTYAAIAPLPFKPGGAQASMQALQQALATMPEITVVTAREGYLYAQAQTRWMRFTDDLEFWVDGTAGAIAVRSASRLGREDFGANRERVEAIRARYLGQTSDAAR